MHWNIFAQQIAFGFVNGIGYALVAIGLTLIFGIMNVTNFAHGEFYMLGSFLIYTIITYLNLDYLPALLLTAIGVGIIGMVSPKVLFIFQLLQTAGKSIMNYLFYMVISIQQLRDTSVKFPLLFLHQRNALFYKTEHGAYIGDVFMSLIPTCHTGPIKSL